MVFFKPFIYNIQRPKKDKKLPVILDASEVLKIISITKNLKHKTMLILTYSGGLRVSELVRLKVNDIDSIQISAMYLQSLWRALVLKVID